MTPQKLKNLVLTFDAFGTLFTPREPITRQYASVARNYGLVIEENELQDSFRQAYRLESKLHPNYGRDSGLSPPEWWANVIKKTFGPHARSSQPLSEKLISDLLVRFSNQKGYRLYPDVKPLFQMIRQKNSRSCEESSLLWPWDLTVCGIISNSDDRVTSILTSLDLTVGQRAVNQLVPKRGNNEDDVREDLSFVVLSYDIGAEKPDRRMYSAAEAIVQAMIPNLRGANTTSTPHNHNDQHNNPSPRMDFTYLHVGDDLQRDVRGAQSAGWNSILIDRAGGFADNGQRIIKAQADDQEAPPPPSSGPSSSSSSAPPTTLVMRDLRDLRYWNPMS